MGYLENNLKVEKERVLGGLWRNKQGKIEA